VGARAAGAAAEDANLLGRDGDAADGGMIPTMGTAAVPEGGRATRDVYAVAAKAIAAAVAEGGGSGDIADRRHRRMRAKRRRRKAEEGANAATMTTMKEEEEEDEAETIAAIDVGGTKDGVGDPDAIGTPMTTT
jgi:hypothetical protein